MNGRTQVEKPPKGDWNEQDILSASFSWLLNMSATLKRRVVVRRLSHWFYISRDSG